MEDVWNQPVWRSNLRGYDYWKAVTRKVIENLITAGKSENKMCSSFVSECLINGKGYFIDPIKLDKGLLKTKKILKAISILKKEDTQA